MKAMRGRIAVQKHFVRNARQRPLSFREALGVRARPRVAFETLPDTLSGTDPAQIAFRGSLDRRFGVRENVRFPPRTVNLFEGKRFDRF
jgi:hypothetical protein